MNTLQWMIICLLGILSYSSCVDAGKKENVSLTEQTDMNASKSNTSDPEAIVIAQEVMQAMGGKQAWDEARYIGWTFFGRRTHLWDKMNMHNTLTIPRDSMKIMIDLEDQTGQVFRGDEELTDPDSISKYIDQGYKLWINDSYWLVMPYKLQDEGVTLQYIGRDTTTTGEEADVMEMTFEGVGLTPDNKYKVYVDRTSRLVTQWDFYTRRTDTIPRFQSPWSNYAKYGDLMMSGGQIRGNKITDISVMQSLDTSDDPSE